MRSSLRCLKALIKKEFYQIIRDPSSILISFVLPLMLLFLYGFGLSLDLDHLALGLMVEDESAEAQALVASFQNSRYFDLTFFSNQKEVNKALTNSSIRGFVHVPSYFSQFKKRPTTTAPLLAVGDGSEPNTAGFLQNYVAETMQIWLQQEALLGRASSPPLIQPLPRFWYNEELESRFFIIPGSLAIIMTLIGTLLTALVVAREWERGTMEALMATPVGIIELVLGKLIPYFILGMASMGMCVLLSFLLYQLPFRGSILALIGISAVFLCCALGTGLLISTLARNQIVASQVSIIVGFLPAYMLSGFIFEISSMPLPIRVLTFLIPARYLVSSLQTLFLSGNVWSLFMANLIPLLVMSLLICFITARKSTKRLD